MARDSQNENGNCADLPSAAATAPAAITSRHGSAAPASPARLSEPVPATAHPAAR
jgi:hypothetical protein